MIIWEAQLLDKMTLKQFENTMSIILNQSIHGKFSYIQYFSNMVICYVAGI